LSDRQFLISKSKKIEIKSKNGVKSQSDSYRTDGLWLGEAGGIRSTNVDLSPNAK